MKFILFVFNAITLTLSLSACSIAHSKNISKTDLLRSKAVAIYVIEDDIDGVLKVLNNKGEVVVNSVRFDTPVYLQIFATPAGIKVQQFDKIEVRSYDKDEYDFID